MSRIGVAKNHNEPIRFAVPRKWEKGLPIHFDEKEEGAALKILQLRIQLKKAVFSRDRGTADPST